MKRGIALSVMLLCLLMCRCAGAETFLVLSDPHLTADEGTLTEVLDAVRCAAEEANGLIVLGDIANSGRPEEHRRAAAFLRKLRLETGCPVYTLPGNHDLSGRMGRAELAALYGGFGWEEAAYRDGETLSCALRTAGGRWLILLDLNACDERGQADACGRVTGGLLSWLETVLTEIGGGENAVVCAHFPIQPVETETVADGGRLFELLVRKGVSLYLCGHRHLHETFREGGLRQITVGMPQSDPCCLGLLSTDEEGWSYTLRPLFDGGDAYFLARQEETRQTGVRMALGSLQGTAYEGDRAAAEWFAEAFRLYVQGRLAEHAERLKADENCGKWRKAEVRQATRRWILSIVENTKESVWSLEGRWKGQ